MYKEFKFIFEFEPRKENFRRRKFTSNFHMLKDLGKYHLNGQNKPNKNPDYLGATRPNVEVAPPRHLWIRYLTLSLVIAILSYKYLVFEIKF